MPTVVLNATLKDKFYDNFSSIKKVVLETTKLDSSARKRAHLNDLKRVNKHHFEESRASP